MVLYDLMIRYIITDNWYLNVKEMHGNPICLYKIYTVGDIKDSTDLNDTRLYLTPE